ncbi:TWiK family of potassium channels protein 7-like [Eriocheir sinensis]|uniref:TWiK family of potassium channels protein 7-like n=1 Tax=Eriocheir sinensis TaxID=95602 RepID=UPI0021CA9697|nr:TWiK family of potassium channels protein 7-like [Eriocheir sinensis]
MEINEYAESGFYTRKERSAGSLCCSFLCSHVGLFFLVAVYAIAGAYAFIAIERPNEETLIAKKQQRAIEVNQAMNYVGDLFWYYQQDKTWTNEDYAEQVTLDLNRLERFVISSVADYHYDGTVNGWVDAWTFPKSLLLTMTIMSTIGYGHIYPVTDEGKVFCILYSLVGCPLLLIFLGGLGNSIADTFIFIYSRICCRWCRSRRNEEELPPDASKKQRKLLVDDEVGKEEYMPTESLYVPIIINLTLLEMYIMLGAVLFSYWEGWDLTSSSYFTFITLSTVGYGDMVPGNAILVSDDDGSGTITMFICIFYIVLGMALLSTCINLMQEQLLDKCHWLAREVGISNSEDKRKNTRKGKKNNKPPKGKKQPPPSPIPEDVEQGPPTPPAPRDKSPSAGKLRSRSNSPVKSNTLAPPQNPNLPESRAPSPFVPSNCSTPIPGSLDDAD